MLIKLRGDKRGSGMAELIAGLAVGCVVIAAAAGIYMTVLRALNTYAGINDSQMLVDAVADLMRHQFAYAFDMEIDHSGGQKEGYHVFTVGSDGRIYLDGEMLYSEDYYKDREFECRVFLEKGCVIHAEILLRDENEEVLCESSVVIRLVNMELNPTNEGIAYGFTGHESAVISDSQDINFHYRLRDERIN